MELLSNAPQRTIIGLEGYGLTVVGQQAIRIDGAGSAQGGKGRER